MEMFLFQVSYQLPGTNLLHRYVGAYHAVTAMHAVSEMVTTSSINALGQPSSINDTVQPNHTLNISFTVTNMGEIIRVEAADGSGEQRDILRDHHKDAYKPFSHPPESWNIVPMNSGIQGVRRYKEMVLRGMWKESQYYQEV